MEVDKSGAQIAADKAKNSGNDQFKLGNYEQAIGFYTDAISKFEKYLI
jgi:tetratricopeptide (TPR) repeat protein